MCLANLLKGCGRDEHGLRDAALLRIAYDTGMRRSELVAIDVAHIDGPDAERAGVVHIPASKIDRAGAGAGAEAYLAPATNEEGRSYSYHILSAPIPQKDYLATVRVVRVSSGWSLVIKPHAITDSGNKMERKHDAIYPAQWAGAMFGAAEAENIAALLTSYARYAARRKPELIDQDSFPLGQKTGRGPLDGGEFGILVSEWDALEAKMLDVRKRLTPEQLDTFFQLVEHPISALANLYRLYYAAAWNKRLASDNDPRANGFADQVEFTFRRDGELTDRCHTIADGKWDGMMAQVHMNNVIWNDPVRQAMPSITRVGGDVPEQIRSRPARFAPASMPEGVVTIEALAVSRTRHAAGLAWTAIRHLGHGRGAVVALPQGRAATAIADGVCAEYDTAIDWSGETTMDLHLVPTLDVTGGNGPRVGVSVDDGEARILTLQLEATGGAQDNPAKRRWADAVRTSAAVLRIDLGPLKKGQHVVKLLRIDDNVVPQRIVLKKV